MFSTVTILFSQTNRNHPPKHELEKNSSKCSRMSVSFDLDKILVQSFTSLKTVLHHDIHGVFVFSSCLPWRNARFLL